jgi:hypothetical protein
MDRIVKLTKIKEFEKSSNSSIDVGVSVEGIIAEGSVFPKKPTVGLPFVIHTYRTSMVKEILSENTFRTHNAVYKFEFLN